MASELVLKLHPDSTSEFVLEGTTILIRNRWSTRNSTWRIDILDSSGDEIVSGLKLLPLQSLISAYRDSRLPIGDLVITGTFPEGEEAKFASLGDEIRLIYVTSEELES